MLRDCSVQHGGSASAVLKASAPRSRTPAIQRRFQRPAAHDSTAAATHLSALDVSCGDARLGTRGVSGSSRRVTGAGVRRQ
jgi:hypothetical protein